MGIDQFVEVVREAAAEGRDALDQALRSTWPTWSSVSEFVRLERGRCTRTLVYRDDSVEILVLGWAKGARSPIHNLAGQASWALTIRGALELTEYRLMKGGRRPGEAFIEPAGATKRLREGDLDSRADSEDVYALRSADKAPYSVSIQVRAAPIERYLVYDTRRARCEERPLYYDFVGPRRQREVVPGLLQDERRHVFAAARAGLRMKLERWAEHARQAGEELLVPADVSKEDAHVQVEDVAHSYGSVEALRDVNLNVRSHDFMCLLGPSGCGKSTLLQALAGHIRPTRGLLTIDGKPVERPGPDRLLMFQDAGLFPWMTVEQNLTFVLAERGHSRRERRRRAREYLRLVQLDGFEKSLPHQLSGGMKMRTSLARALAMDPPVLLMDEPFGSLDSQTRGRMHELVQRLWMDRKTTVVFVTHDVNEALLLATRVVLMAARPGRVAWDLEVRLPYPRDLYDPKLTALANRVRAEIGGDQAEQGESEWDGVGSYAQ